MTKKKTELSFKFSRGYPLKILVRGAVAYRTRQYEPNFRCGTQFIIRKLLIYQNDYIHGYINV